MTDTPSPVALTPFEGSAVRKVGIEIPGAAGGLREALKFEPVELHKGETVYVVLECTVAKVRFDPTDKDDLLESDWTRVHVLDTESAALVDGNVVAEHLAEQKRRLQRAKEAAQGIDPLANGDVKADDWGAPGPLDEPDVDAETAKVIEGAFGAPADDEWTQAEPPPPADAEDAAARANRVPVAEAAPEPEPSAKTSRARK